MENAYTATAYAPNHVTRQYGVKKQLHFWNTRPWLAYPLCTFGGSTMNVIKVICENNAQPCVKRRMSFCACAKSRDLLKYPIAVVLADVDLPHWTSKVEHIAAFTAIFSNICIAHEQKRLFMNFRCKFRHRRSIRRPRFPIRVQDYGDLATFSVEFCIFYVECPPYFYFRFVWHTNLESRPRFAYSLCNFGCSIMKVIKVICENNARPVLKKRMRFCACAKSRDLFKVA